MKMYGIMNKKTGKLMRLSVIGNDSLNFDGGYEATLNDVGPPYLIDTRIKAKRVLVNPTDGYDSQLGWPQLGNNKAEDLEVVEVELKWNSKRTFIHNQYLG